MPQLGSVGIHGGDAMSLIDQIEALGYEADIEFLTIETATQLLMEFSHGELTAAGAQDLILHWQTARSRCETELRKATT